MSIAARNKKIPLSTQLIRRPAPGSTWRVIGCCRRRGMSASRQLVQVSTWVSRWAATYPIIPYGVNIHKNATPTANTSRVWLERPRRLNNACISAPTIRTARHKT